MNRFPAPHGDAALAPAAGSGSRAVRLALAALRAALAQDPAATPALAALAAAAATSPRSLQRQFAASLGLSPLAVGRRLRLAAARQTLARGDAASVLDAAMRHGFDHPGRFAMAYAAAYGEHPSATLRAAPRGGAAAAAGPELRATIELRALAAPDGPHAARARRATDDLAIAISRAPDLALAERETTRPAGVHGRFRIGGRIDGDAAVLELVDTARGIVAWAGRLRLVRRGAVRWADRAVGAIRAVIDAEDLAVARRVPRRLADADALVRRARPVALSQEVGNAVLALDLLNDALHRDPAHALAHALSGWMLATGTNHCFWNDPDASRARAIRHGQRALALAPDDADVVSLVGDVMLVARRVDEGERLLNRALALDPTRSETWRRLGLVRNFRGDGRAGAAYLRRALAMAAPGADSSAMQVRSLTELNLGIAKFISGDYRTAARLFIRALAQQPARLWPHRFLAASLAQLGERSAARRSVDAVRRGFPDIGLQLVARASPLPREPLGRVLDGLEAAGMPP